MPTPILQLQEENLTLQLPVALFAASVTIRQMMPLPLLLANVTHPGEMTILVTVEDRYAQLAHLMLASYEKRVAQRDNHTSTELLAEAIDSLVRTASEKPIIEVCITSPMHEATHQAAENAFRRITGRIREMALARTADDGP